MKRNANNEEFKEVLKLIKEYRGSIRKFSECKEKLFSNLDNLIKNNIDFDEKQDAQIELLYNECNYEIELLLKGSE